MKKAKLRRLNGWISRFLIVLLLFHVLTGSLLMVGVIKNGILILRILANILALFLIIHIIIGVIFVIDTQKIKKQTKAPYQSLNRSFWLRRDSGFAMVILLVLHLPIFITDDGLHNISNPFGIFQLIISILLLLSILVHVGTNLLPLFIAFGQDGHDLASKLKLIATVIIVALATIAFVYYFIRWNIFFDFGGMR